MGTLLEQMSWRRMRQRAARGESCTLSCESCTLLALSSRQSAAADEAPDA